MKALLDSISLFPQMFGILKENGITARAFKKGIWSHQNIHPRDFSCNQYGQIDDKPYGGGPGMVMQAKPLEQAILKAKKNQQENGAKKSKVIYLSAQGSLFHHRKMLDFLNFIQENGGLIFLCGRYEGVDERVLMRQVDEEICLGDFILSGGELAALSIMDSIIRHLPCALHSKESLATESFCNGLLEYPQYTRPEEYEGLKVPAVLLSGNHHAIFRWRLKESLRRTRNRRPDLLAKRTLSALESQLLEELSSSELCGEHF